MNKVILMGRLTKDPEVIYSATNSGENLAIARFTLAVDRKYRKRNESENQADFLPCVAFGKLGELAEHYYKKGTKLALVGRIQTDSFTNKDGKKVYTTEVVVEEAEFAESKQQAEPKQSATEPLVKEGFMDIPEGIEESLPFK